MDFVLHSGAAVAKQIINANLLNSSTLPGPRFSIQNINKSITIWTNYRQK